MSSLGSGKPRHPMRNSRLLFLVRRLSFTLSTKYYGLSLLDASNMFTLVRIAVDFTPADVDVSLKDLPPESSETVLLFLPLPPSPVFVLSLLFTIFARGMEFFFKKNKKVVIFCWNFHSVTHRPGGATGAHSIRESGLCLCV